MFRALLSALSRGLRTAWESAWSFVFWPIRFIGGGRPQRSSGIDMKSVAAFEQQVPTPSITRAEVLQSHQRECKLVHAWIATSLALGQLQPIPKLVSRKTAGWLQGLNHAQLVALKNAGAEGIFAHSTGEKTIASVPKVATLAPVTVRFAKPAKPVADIDHARAPEDFENAPVPGRDRSSGSRAVPAATPFL